MQHYMFRKRSDLLNDQREMESLPHGGTVWTGSQVASEAGPWTYSVQ